MASANKSRAFIAARKRGIGPEVVRAILFAVGAPPTLSEKPAKREGFETQDDIGRMIPRTRRVKDDYRNCSEEQVDLAVAAVCAITGNISRRHDND